MKDQYYHALLKHLLSFMAMPDNFPDLFFPGLTEPITYADDYLVFRPEDVADMAYWPVEGHIRTYIEVQPEPDREMKKQLTEDISLPDCVFLLQDSFILGQLAGCFVEITKGSTVIGYSRKHFLELEKLMPEVTSLALKVISAARRNQLNKTNICKLPGAEAYEAFRKLYGEKIEGFVYLKDIATFLGTTPGNLSRIRSEGGYGEEGLRKKGID